MMNELHSQNDYGLDPFDESVSNDKSQKLYLDKIIHFCKDKSQRRIPMNKSQRRIPMNKSQWTNPKDKFKRQIQKTNSKDKFKRQISKTIFGQDYSLL